MSGIGQEVRGSRHCRSQRKIIGNNKCSNFDNDFRFFLWRNKRRELYGEYGSAIIPPPMVPADDSTRTMPLSCIHIIIYRWCPAANSHWGAE